MRADNDPRVMLVASTGGHLAQLAALKPFWSTHPRVWVTFNNGSASSEVAGERVEWAFFPTTRNLPNAIRNAFLAVRLLRRYRPTVVISTGAGVAVPFFFVAKILRIHTVYIEVIDRIESRTLTGRILYPIVSAFIVQWPEQLKLYPRAEIIGPTL